MHTRRSSGIPARSFAFACLVLAGPFAPSEAGGASSPSPSRLREREARVDAQMIAGDNVEAFAGAVDILEDRLAASGPRAPEAVEALGRVARSLMELRDYELADAIWHLTRVAASETMGPCHPRVAETLLGLGSTAKWVAPRYDDMLPYFRDAASMLDPDVPEQYALLGRACLREAFYYWYRDRERSIHKFEESLSIQEAVAPGSLDAATARAWLGWTLLQLGHHDEARTQLLLARDGLHTGGFDRLAVAGTVESALADLGMLAGDWAHAEAGYRRAIHCYERVRRIGSTRFADFPLHGYNLIALAQLKQGQEDEAWRSLQCYRGLNGKRLHSLGEWRTRAPQSFAQVRALREELIQRRGLRRCLQPVRALSEVNWDAAIGELVANARLFRLEAAYFASDVTRATGIAELQAVLPDDYAYIGWLESKIGDELLNSSGRILDSRWMYVVRSRGRVIWIPLWEGTSVPEQNRLRVDASDYGKIAQRAAEWTLRVDDDPRLATLARCIAAQEFNAALPHLGGVDHLVVEFFEDRVGWKPVEALVLPDGTYLGDRFAVAYSPSADAFVASQRSHRARGSSDRVVAIGDPIFRSEERNNGTSEIASGNMDVRRPSALFDRALHRAATNGDPSALNALPRLPHARTEIDNLRRAFPQCVTMCGDEATEANVRSLFKSPGGASFGIVHMATHALTETWLGQRCALAMTRRGVDGTPVNDGLIDALEIQLGWELDVDLVTLSACQTVAAPGWLRGEPRGLSSILLGVGARSVLANLWQVDDLAAAHLMSRFYENLSGRYTGEPGERDSRPMDRAVALAEAKRWLRNYEDDSGRRPFAHPVYWSGFILIGAPQ